jgi:hypothetical protein
MRWALGARADVYDLARCVAGLLGDQELNGVEPMLGRPIVWRVDGYGADVEFVGGATGADGDLPAVGHQNLAQRHGCPQGRKFRPFSLQLSTVCRIHTPLTHSLYYPARILVCAPHTVFGPNAKNAPESRWCARPQVQPSLSLYRTERTGAEYVVRRSKSEQAVAIHLWQLGQW